MSMNKVNIILCTYNGEKYIEKQLDSILNQTYQNIDIYIHDDGSKDCTLEKVKLVKERNRTNKKIIILNETNNLGYPECFIKTLLDSDKSDYYAFSDQDDIWNPDKIELAVKCLDDCKDIHKKPVLYYSAVDYYDEELNFKRHSRFATTLKKKTNDLGLLEFLFGGEPLGMTYVFNNKVRDALGKTHELNFREFKDGFIKIYCAAAGKVVYDRKSSAKYVRHPTATTAASNPDSMIKRYFAMFDEMFLKKDTYEYFRNIVEVLLLYFSDEISEENKKLLQFFTRPNYIYKRMKKVFYNGRFRNVFTDEIAYRLLFLIGRV